jgi:hypothetical protein
VLGSAYLLLPALGALLGYMAAVSAGTQVPVPSLSLVLALLVLGIFDSAAGLIGVAVFAAVVGLSGGLATPGQVRLMMGLGGMWFVTPLLAGAARPLRRVPAQTREELWDRAADFVVASLVGAWAVQKIVQGLSGLAGFHVPLVAEANVCALVVLLALVGRIALETLVANLYPRRLAAVQPAMQLGSNTALRLLGLVTRTAVFVFVAIAFVGPVWQLWVGVALFVLPQLGKVYEARYPNLDWLYRWLPRGLLKLVVVLILAKLVGSLVSNLSGSHREVVANAFIIVALPAVALAVLGLVGRVGPETPLTWKHRAAGAALLLVGLVAVLAFP